MLNPMVQAVGKPHSLRLSGQDTWDHVKLVQSKVACLTEMDHQVLPFDQYQHWKAFDFYNFIMCEVAVICCDEHTMRDTELYAVWVHFANAMYLLLHGRQTERIMKAGECAVQAFAKAFKKKFDEANCTWKFHVFQHFPELVRRHGPAFLWDAFIYERLLGFMGKDVTTTRQQVLQATRNFMLRHHSSYFQNSDKYVEECRSLLEEIGGCAKDASLTKLTIEPMALAPNVGPRPMLHSHMEQFRAAAASALGLSTDQFHAADKDRVTRLRRYLKISLKTFDKFAMNLMWNVCALSRFHLTISSAVYKRKENSNTEDSFIQVDNRFFGQVVEILWLRDQKAAFLLLQVYEKSPLFGENGLEVPFPVNQFPVSIVHGQTKVFHVTKRLFIQKIVRSELHLRKNALASGHPFFSIRPNEWFRF
jgi:hypothetical protein